jgi:hypothetical protein
VRDEFVEGSLSNELFEVVEKMETLFVRNTAECIIRVLSFQVNDELSEFVISSELINRVLQCFPANLVCC